MKRIIIPDAYSDVPRRAPFFLAAEEWAAKNLCGDDEFFFAWQVLPAAICGRHQHIPSEVNLNFARANSIDIIRRKSGGGAIYADSANVMFSYISAIGDDQSVAEAFGRYTSRICAMLGALGLDASATGRNDIAIDSRKVAGNAYLKKNGRAIVHGTMLYDANPDMISKVLTPSVPKLKAKGVKSVPARVTTLRQEGLQLPIRDFIDFANSFLCPANPVVLTQADISEIELIERSYYDPEFLNLNADSSSFGPFYIDGIGQISLDCISDSNGNISHVKVAGDFFCDKSEIESRLFRSLKGIKNSPKEIVDCLSDDFPGMITFPSTLLENITA